ncbi:MAG: hypothetical protein HYY24_07610 [Verrucomicrobia bacterium]|nr:hypothetical protein [Verrucomicrobiota bacterium]
MNTNATLRFADLPKSKGPVIQYDTAELERQWPAIVQSQLNAMRRIISDAYCRAAGLSLDDPPELWRFVLAQSEQSPPLTKKEEKQAQRLAPRLRQLDPQFVGDLAAHQRLRDSLRSLTLRETALSLANRTTDDAKLANHLATLLKIYSRGSLTQADLNSNRADQNNTTRILIQHWIQDPTRETWVQGPPREWAIASLCFYSDLAMAKAVYWLAKPSGRREWLPATRLNKEPERIRKLYGKLGLIPAKHRVIKDIKFEAGKIRFEPFRQTIHRRA